MNESVKMHAKRCALQGIITSFIKTRNSDMATSKNIIPHISLSTLIADKLRPSFPYKFAIYLTIEKSKLDLSKNLYMYLTFTNIMTANITNLKRLVFSL